MARETFHHDPGYAAARRQAYERELPLAEFVDAFAKERAGDPGPMQAYLARRQAIKARHPKPDKPDPTI